MYLIYVCIFHWVEIDKKISYTNLQHHNSLCNIKTQYHIILFDTKLLKLLTIFCSFVFHSFLLKKKNHFPPKFFKYQKKVQKIKAHCCVIKNWIDTFVKVHSMEIIFKFSIILSFTHNQKNLIWFNLFQT